VIHIRIERAVEELVEMILTESQRKVLVIGGRRNIARMYQHIVCEIVMTNNTYNLRHAFNYDCDKHINDNYSLCSVDFATTNDSHFRGHRYDLILIDTKIDPKFHDEIRLSLRQNSIIPEEKQIQFFDIEQDKVWFEKEYKRELYEQWRDELRLINNMDMGTNWIRKQTDSYVKRKQMDAYDQYLTSKIVLEMIEQQDKIIYQSLMPEDKKEEEKQMSDFANNFETHKQNVPKITDIDIIVPDKVVKVYFVDGTNMKMVCHEEDIFDLKRCLFIAIAKKLFKDRYTWEGIEHKATELSYLKSVTKVVDKALKDFNKKQEAIAKLEKNAEEEKKSRAKKKAKHDAYLKRRDERRQKEIDEKNRQQFEYDVAVQVEAAKRIREEETKGHF